MTERWLRRDDDFMKFQPGRAIVAPTLKNRSADRWSVFQKLTVLLLVSLLLAGAIYFLPV